MVQGSSKCPCSYFGSVCGTDYFKVWAPTQPRILSICWFKSDMLLFTDVTVLTPMIQVRHTSRDNASCNKSKLNWYVLCFTFQKSSFKSATLLILTIFCPQITCNRCGKFYDFTYCVRCFFQLHLVFVRTIVLVTS